MNGENSMVEKGNSQRWGEATGDKTISGREG